MNVKILVTCRKEELLEGSILVFETLRRGFPTAKIEVFLNNIELKSCKELIVKRARSCKCKIVDLEKTTIHHEWINDLLSKEVDPFYILDTDVIFWSNFERFNFEEHPMAGRRIPEWNDEFTRARTRARLHTSLLYFNPEVMEENLTKYFEQFPSTPFNPFPNLVNPVVIPYKGKAFFHDTCCLLYHAIGGFAFQDEHLETHDHMNFSTITDIVYPQLSMAKEMEEARQAIYRNPDKAKGLWRLQELYYQARQ